MKESSWFQDWWGRPGWERFVHVTAATALVVAISIFITLARHAPDGAYLEPELRLMRRVREAGAIFGEAHASGVMRDLTGLGSAVVLVLLILLLLGYFWLTRRHRIAALLAIATAGGQAMNLLFKHGFSRARPDSALHLVEVTSSSFPSGHSMASSIFYLTVGALLAGAAERRREKTYFVLAALSLTFLIGLSRVYLGVHYPTDVLAGWSAGTAWALVCWFVADWLGRRGELKDATP